MSDGTALVKKTHAEVGTTVTPGNELKGDAERLDDHLQRPKLQSLTAA